MVLTDNPKQAIKKLDAEMEQAKDLCSKYIAEQLLQLATSCPEVAEKILAEKKSLAGALDAIKAEAKKHAVGGCACIDEIQTMEIACIDEIQTMEIACKYCDLSYCGIMIIVDNWR